MSVINSASLIMLKRIKNVIKNVTVGDFKILLLKRVKETRSFSSNIVFPGGMLEESDRSDGWIDLLGGYFNNATLKALRPMNSSALYETWHDCAITPEVAYRICSVRETFEETGVLVAIDKEGRRASEDIMETVIKEGWQNKVRNSSKLFLELFRSFDLYPDLQSLAEWSLWITPKAFKRRFRTIFFVNINSCDVTIHSNIDEAKSVFWSSTDEALQLYYKNEGQLAPPQVIEMTLFNTMSSDQVIDLATLRRLRAVPIILPVIARLKDGNIMLLPGDLRYPVDDNDADLSHLTFEDISHDKNIRRSIYNASGQLNIQSNYVEFQS